MQTQPHHRKIELQSPSDLIYLHTNAVALSRQKLDLHLPPSAAAAAAAAATNRNDNNQPQSQPQNHDHDDQADQNQDQNETTEPEQDPDPMRERVKQLVDEFISKTFSSAASSISINGLDSTTLLNTTNNTTSNQQEGKGEGRGGGGFLFTPPTETIEYEPYDTRLASRVTSLYAQLESLITTVAQLRRDAPARAAREYGDQLDHALIDDLSLSQSQSLGENDVDDVDDWRLNIPLGSDQEAIRWRNGDVASVYENTLRTLLHLQGEREEDDEFDFEGHAVDNNINKDRDDSDSESTVTGGGGDALATTVGKAERAGRAAEVVENL